MSCIERAEIGQKGDINSLKRKEKREETIGNKTREKKIEI
jgi:hypothetical protein